LSHKVTIALLRALERMAVEGVPRHEAARRIGVRPEFVVYWASKRHVPFQPRQNRGMPAWLMPELARQAEMRLRATWEVIRCL
jgi:hypothetical protein